MKELRLKVKNKSDYNLLIRLANRLGIDVKEIIDDEVRELTSDSDAFSFWEDPREDLYQDYLKSEDDNR